MTEQQPHLEHLHIILGQPRLLQRLGDGLRLLSK